MIAVINYGSGNIQAISNIYKRLNIPCMVASIPDDLLNAKKIILPGVGTFDQAIGELQASNMLQSLEEHVLVKKKFFLGICLGMQLLAKSSEEGKAKGLGWIDGRVIKFDHAKFKQSTHLPHMGWNTVSAVKESLLFNNVDMSFGYYFLHSYYFSCEKKEDRLAVTEYGGNFASAVNAGNIYGVQFHPEKSHLPGIQLLKNFANL
jgi:glutamine amidotransferase